MKILVVDDSSTMRRIICNTLKTIGQENVVEGGDGVEGLAMLDKNPDVELVLTDWNMPNMNGLDFLTRIRQGKPQLPVVMITTEAEKQNVVTAIKAGANNYIVKPFTPEVLKEKLAAYLK